MAKNVLLILDFTEASADFSQANLPGIQAKGLKGHLLEDNTFIFVWVNGGYRKMVQTSNQGATIKTGYITSSSPSWRNSSTWIDNGSFYTI